MAQPYYPPPRTIHVQPRSRIVVVPTVVQTGTAALTGAGTSTTTALRVATGVAALSGLGSSTSAATRTKMAAAALTGVGTSTTAGVRQQSTSAALTGAGSSTSAGARMVLASVALTGLGSVLSVGLKTRYAQASLSGAGSILATESSLPITDTFTRTGSTWNRADSGHAWLKTGNGTASTNGSAGLVALVNESAYTREEIKLSHTDAGALVRMSMDRATPGGTGSRQFSIQLRQASANTDTAYMCLLNVSSGGVLAFQLALTNTVIAGPTTIVNPYVANDVYWMRFECFLSTIRGKVWKDGTSEPAAWTHSVTNVTRSTGTYLGLRCYSNAAATGVHNQLVDDFSAYRIVVASAALTGTGTSSTTGRRTRFATAALTGTGTSATAGTVTSGAVTHNASAALTGTGMLSGTATRKQIAAVVLTGLGSTLQTGYAKRFAQASPTGNGTLSATPLRKAMAATALAGLGTLSATGTATTPSSHADLTATGTLSAAGAVITFHYATTSLTGMGTLASTATRIVYAAADLACGGPPSGEEPPPVVTVSGGGPILRIDMQKLGSEAHLFGLGSLHATGQILSTVVAGMVDDDEEALRIAIDELFYGGKR